MKVADDHPWKGPCLPEKDLAPRRGPTKVVTRCSKCCPPECPYRLGALCKVKVGWPIVVFDKVAGEPVATSSRRIIPGPCRLYLLWLAEQRIKYYRLDQGEQDPDARRAVYDEIFAMEAQEYKCPGTARKLLRA